MGIIFSRIWIWYDYKQRYIKVWSGTNDIKLCIYPTGNEKEMRCIELSKLSAKYKVRRLDKKDVDIIYNLSYPNTIFYQYHPPIVTEESILMDMEALPPRKSMEDKYMYDAGGFIMCMYGK